MIRPSTLLILFSSFLIAIGGHAQIRRSLGPPVNNPNFNEYAPSISANGKTMIFESDRGTNGRWELFSSIKNDKGRWSAPKPLTKINSVGNDNDLIGGPSISYDGNTLYFFASFDGGKGDMDLYYSVREGEEWSAPKNMGSPINTEKYEGFPSVSADGKKLYFIRDNFSKRKDKAICYTIWVANKKDDGTWTEPEKIPAPINNDCEKSPRIMADSRTLIFSSIRKEGVGGFDLYQSFQEDDGSWSTPINLDYINTDADDQFASVSAAGDLMYYQNSGDIFTVTIPDKFRKYKLVTIDGKIIDAISKADLNTKLTFKSNIPKERSLVVAPQNGTYNTILRVGSKYTITATVAGYLAFNTVLDLSAAKEGTNIDKDIELIPNKLPFQFQCFDKETKVTLKNPRVKILDIEAKTVTEATVKDDIATVILEIGRSYKFSATAPEVKVGSAITKYSFFARPFKPDSTEAFKDRLKRVPLQPLKVNVPIQLNDVTFETAKADLKPESGEELDRLVKLMEENEEIKIEISAHTDDVGNDDLNMKLSDKRAKSVTNYLVAKGVKIERLTSKGYGKTQPLVPNDSDENRAKNRRVQFKIAQ